MEYKQSELEFENHRLEDTKALALKQLERARKRNEENKLDIIKAKKDMRDNTSHSIPDLWSSDGFEALAELSQDMNFVTDKIVAYEEMELKIILLEKIIKSPYFARIDFKFEGEDDFEKIYIGRASLKEETSHEMYIYDWRSPIASVFYRFLTGKVFYDAPAGRIAGEVNLKRQYEIRDGKLEYFFDADVQIVDAFLRQLLSRNTSNKMKAIVETIQREQDLIIRDMENDLMMVQGVAGSGKTSIALHRAAYLMYQGLSGRLAANNILIISPNSLFEQYISEVLPELGESNVVSIVFEDILASVLKTKRIQSKNKFLENLITSRGYHKIIKRSIEFKTSLQFLDILNQFIKDLPHKWIEFEDVYYEDKCIVRKEVLRNKVLGREETPLGIKLKQLEGIILDLIRDSNKGRIRKAEKIMIKQEIQKFTEPDLFGLYQKLFRDKAYFRSLSGDSLACSSLDEILDYTQENLDTGYLYYDDAIALAYLHLKMNGAGRYSQRDPQNAYSAAGGAEGGRIRYQDIKQVVIDEAQDYYPLQYEIFHLLFSNSKFTILGDINQTLEKQENLSLYEQIRNILNMRRSSLITMDKSFRCTNEILNYSLNFIEHRPEIKSFNRKGDEPEIHMAGSQKELDAMIAEEVGFCLENGYRSIGLLCKSEKNARDLFESLRDRLELQLIQEGSMPKLGGGFVMPVYMSKGLEFDAVLICDANLENYSSKEDKNLLYIASTRALHRLGVFGIGEASPLL